MEKVDILKPPTFEKSGVVKPVVDALNDEDWLGTFNLWIVQSSLVPSIVYQVRNPDAGWAPNKFDVTAGGFYEAGEELWDGLREVREELGKEYSKDDIHYLGRRLYVGFDGKGRRKHNVVDVSFILDNDSLETYALQEEEVYAVAVLPIQDLIKVHTDDTHTFNVELLTAQGKKEERTVTQDDFPYNWDNYHFKVALLAERFVKGEESLLY